MLSLEVQCIVWLAHIHAIQRHTEQSRYKCNPDSRTCNPQSSRRCDAGTSISSGGSSNSNMVLGMSVVPNVAIKQPTAGPTVSVMQAAPAATVSSAANSASLLKGASCGTDEVQCYVQRYMHAASAVVVCG